MYKLKRLFALIAADTALIILSIYISYLLRFDFVIREVFVTTFPYVFVLLTATIILCFNFFKIYKRIWQYTSLGDLIAIMKGVVAGAIGFYLIHNGITSHFYPGIIVPRSIYPLTIITSFLLIGGSRVVWRLFRQNFGKKLPHQRKALIVGAGEAGVTVVKELKKEGSGLYPIAFIDDNLQKQNFEVVGVPVVGTRNDIPAIVEAYGIEQIIIAIPAASRAVISEIINICKTTGCEIKIVPSLNDLINGKVTLSTLRKVSVEDLLGREPVKINLAEIAEYLRNEIVLITGAGGSIGSEISRQVAVMEPKQMILLDHSENSVYDIELELRKKYPELNLSAIIADIKDIDRLKEVFGTHRPNVVFHAAAHKHVPLMEENPREAVENNVFGTRNVANCAHEYKTKRFVLISTDKAVNPTSVMGTTKRIAEMIIQDLNRVSDTIFAAVRFGNVLGSRGSVIPVFKKQIEEGGPVTVTHPDMIRYFMTIPEAVQLVIQAGALATGGEIFILDMGKPVKIDDLAHDLIRLSGLEPNKDIKVVYTGIRPGEKLFEEILSKEEGATATRHDRIFVGKSLHIPSEQLSQHLNRLGMLRNPEKIKDQLQQIVPSYQWRNHLKSETLHAEDKLQASLDIVASLKEKRI